MSENQQHENHVTALDLSVNSSESQSASSTSLPSAGATTDVDCNNTTSVSPTSIHDDNDNNNEKKENPLVSHLPLETTLACSVVIPCYISHVRHLSFCLNSIHNSTRHPVDVIVVVSSLELDLGAKNILTALRNRKWNFILHIIERKYKFYAGQNRQLGTNKASTDYIICHDADDVMHPQKIAMVMKAFDMYNTKIVVHGYVVKHMEPPQTWWIQYNERRFRSKDIKQIIKNPRSYRPRLRYANGHVCYHKDVIKTVQWGNRRVAEDTLFVKQCWHAFKSMAYIPHRIAVYRQYLTASHDVLRQTTHLNSKRMVRLRKKRLGQKIPPILRSEMLNTAAGIVSRSRKSISANRLKRLVRRVNRARKITNNVDITDSQKKQSDHVEKCITFTQTTTQITKTIETKFVSTNNNYTSPQPPPQQPPHLSKNVKQKSFLLCGSSPPPPPPPLQQTPLLSQSLSSSPLCKNQVDDLCKSIVMDILDGVEENVSNQLSSADSFSPSCNLLSVKIQQALHKIQRDSFCHHTSESDHQIILKYIQEFQSSINV